MNVDPFWLNDRILPSDANDPKEVTRLGRALAELGEDTGDHSRPAVTEAVRRFQDSRGLKVDGLAQVNGPTAQRIAAERHERQTAEKPPAQKRILGEQHSVPVRDAVGAGGRNRPLDRQSVMQALAIGNYLSRHAALNPAAFQPGTEFPACCGTGAGHCPVPQQAGNSGKRSPRSGQPDTPATEPDHRPTSASLSGR